MKQKEGFTLVEVLMVIAIIGLLTAAGVYAFTQVKARARDANRTADTDQLAKALDLYFNSEGAYPVSTTPVCIDGTDIVSTALSGANLLSATVADPIYTDTTNCYRYVSDADGETYAIRFLMETDSILSKGFHIVP